MAYTSGSTILDADYNNFAANVNTVMSTGSGESGYGQTAISTVAAGATVSAAQWATLINNISTAASHQGTTITSITSPVTADTITAAAALSSNITSITNSNKNAAASGTAITSGGVSSRTTLWNGTVNTTQTVTFSTAEQMRFFFNAGGVINLTFSRTGGTASNKNTGWSDLCTASGTIALTGAAASKTIAATAYTGTTKIGGSGTTTILATTLGETALTGIFQDIFQQYDASANYTANYITVAASNQSATSVDFRTTFQDDANANTDEDVDGTLSVTVTVVPPSTTNLTSTWGTPVISIIEAL